MGKMRKWEMEYERYSNSTELDDAIELLQNKIDGKVAFKEEFKEHKRLVAIKENLPKVKNLLDFRKKLEQDKEDIAAELMVRKEVAESSKVSKDLEAEMEKLLEEHDLLEQEMKNATSNEEKAKIQEKMKENLNKRNENNQKFSEAQEMLASSSSKIKNPKMEVSELEEKSCQISSKISKCNMAARKLMEGKSWKAIDVALDKWKDAKFVAKGEQVEKLNKNKEAAKLISVLKSKSETEQSLAVVDQEKKTFFSKIAGFFKNIKNKITSKLNKENESEKETESKLEDNKTTTQNTEKTKGDDDFRKYLKEIAEKGMDGIEVEAKLLEERKREEEISKSAQRIFEAKKAAAETAKQPFDEAGTMAKARKVAENSYNKKKQDEKGNGEAR